MITNAPLSRFQAWFQRIPLLRSRKGLIAVGVTLLLILIFWRFFLRGPSTLTLAPPALQSPTGSEGSIDLELPSSWPSYPDTLPVYELTAYTPLEEGAQAWASQLGLTPYGSLGRTFTNANRTEVLTISPGNQGVTLTRTYPEASAAPALDQSLTKLHLETFLEGLGFVPSEFAMTERMLADDDTHLDEVTTTTDPTQASRIQYFLEPRIETYAMRWEAGAITTMTITVTNQGVVQATLPTFPYAKQSAGQARTFSSADIERNVEAGSYVIIGTVGRGEERGKLIALEADTAEIEYRVSTSTREITPFVQLTGTGRFLDGKTFPVQITTPLTQ